MHSAHGKWEEQRLLKCRFLITELNDLEQKTVMFKEQETLF